MFIACVSASLLENGLRLRSRGGSRGGGGPPLLPRWPDAFLGPRWSSARLPGPSSLCRGGLLPRAPCWFGDLERNRRRVSGRGGDLLGLDEYLLRRPPYAGSLLGDTLRVL